MILPGGSLVLLVGPPAAGKSTLATALVAAGEVAADDVLSIDTRRSDAGGRGRDPAMWERVRHELDERMAAGRTTVIDATNINPARRALHLAVAQAHGRPVVAIRFEVDAAELVERNAGRKAAVPQATVITLAVEMDELADVSTLRTDGVDLVLDAEDVRQRLP